MLPGQNNSLLVIRLVQPELGESTSSPDFVFLFPGAVEVKELVVQAWYFACVAQHKSPRMLLVGTLPMWGVKISVGGQGSRCRGSDKL
ncbi:hypothetical protein DPEC_G00076610 [Dallia pectoralis]|uniref:Uncharacterized protein n=1 Tax=Dallia pectoralis TaxID=75939 RepID=A0ACC2H3P4_DALPE|nr:hypothetical protein DPEC_G00076610 [Dallia pectoralis]